MFFYVYTILSNLGVPVGTLVAGAGILSVAIGLGTQGLVSDVINGLTILIEGQLRVGDSVTIQSIDGTVVSIGLRTIELRALDGTLHYLPNRSITTISNHSQENQNITISCGSKIRLGLMKPRICYKINYPKLNTTPPNWRRESLSKLRLPKKPWLPRSPNLHEGGTRLSSSDANDDSWPDLENSTGSSNWSGKLTLLFHWLYDRKFPFRKLSTSSSPNFNSKIYVDIYYQKKSNL